MTLVLRPLAVAIALLVSSCAVELPSASFPCLSDSVCAHGYVCDREQQRCVQGEPADPPHDAGAPPVRDDGGARGDGGAPDASVIDAGRPDGGASDAGLVDAGLVDAGPDDAGLVDAGRETPPALAPLVLYCDEQTPCPFVLDASDDGPPSALTGLVVTPPARGTLSPFDGLDATYTPDDDAIGQDSFEVRVGDGAAVSEVVTVVVHVVSRRSCAHLLLSRGDADSGVFTLLPDGPGGPSVPAYCDMERAGGGWALALKADGRQQTFTYASALWTDENLHNETALALDDVEAKLAAFRDLPLAQVLVLMRSIGAPWATAESLVLDARGSSLQQVFAAGLYVGSRAGSRAWLGMLANTTLQPNCLLEGLNVSPAATANQARARVGIVANEQPDCASPDSFIGVGTSVVTCGDAAAWSVGNRSCYGAQPVDQNVPASAALLVRPDDFSGLDPRASCSAHHAAGRRIDGVYPLDPDGDGVAFPAYCDMTTDGGGWTLLMRVAGNGSSHVLDNDAVGPLPCRPSSSECRLASATIDELLARDGTEVLAVRPDGRYQPWFLRAEGDVRWPLNLECANRPSLASDPRHEWILTSYRHLAGAELAQGGDLGDFTGAGHYYPTLYAPEQAFFRGHLTGLRAQLAWDAAPFDDRVPGTLWVRTSGYEHVGVAESCAAHLALGRRTSGVYLVGEAEAPQRVYCGMETHGGGWTVLASYSGADGENSITTGDARAEGNPFGFGHVNLDVTSKIARSGPASESLVVRAGGRWLHVDAPLFDERLALADTDVTLPVTLTSDDGTSVAGAVGWSTGGIGWGGDFGISVATPPFDKHSPAVYRMLNAGCAGMLLYSFSAIAGDDDVGYDANTALGSWSPTHVCEGFEGGRLRFYVAVR